MDELMDEIYIVKDSSVSPRSSSFLEMRCGRTLITILGILIGFTCAVILLLKDRKFVSNAGAVLLVFMSLFIVYSVMFITTSVLLLLATLDNNVDLISNYTWYSMVYLCIQLVLALVIPIVLVVDGRPLTPIVLTWLIIVLVIGLGWTHYVAIVDSYRMELVNVLSI